MTIIIRDILKNYSISSTDHVKSEYIRWLGCHLAHLGRENMRILLLLFISIITINISFAHQTNDGIHSSHAIIVFGDHVSAEDDKKADEEEPECD